MTELPPAALELSLDPADLPLLLRHPAFRAAARRKPQRVTLIWHDTKEGALADIGRALAERHEQGIKSWRLERAKAGPAELWPPGGTGPVLAHADSLEGLGHRLPASLLPVAAFEGLRRRLTPPDAAVAVTCLDGQLRAVTATAPVCRVVLSGPSAEALALELAAQMRLEAPRRSLAGEALALAGRTLPDRPLGPPLLAPEMNASTGFAFVVAHLSGVILHHAALAHAAGGPEPVHQMRVALRRLRSAIQLFRRAVACPELDALRARLKALGTVLGPARDWDVFTAGTGRKVAAAFAGDAAVAALLAAAERRRLACYAALRRYLASAAFRETGIALAALSLTRPWEDASHDDPAQAAPASPASPASQASQAAELRRTLIADYAAHALNRRLARVTAPGGDILSLDLPALHDIRLHAKRLRYASEFFSPLFPGRDTRRFLRRLSAVQERLGLINDGATAQALMAELGGRGGQRLYAVGVVRGFVAGGGGLGLRKLERTWHRFRKQEPFWS